ncbi:secondary metabolism regulator LAE1 [Trichoderma asperellum]|uniref:Secondary metabolism regulator LAE1 n=1 Tax=Trichoderma asperellum TaxID=101201 RepID=A0A6V8R090_TRIAP|nr:secondary metabolism regulator LAE1 [Trichoderma asperellum]
MQPRWPVISFGFLVSRPSGIYLGAAKSSISTAIWPTSIRGPVLSYGQFRDRRCQTPRRRCLVLADRVIGVALDPSLSPLLLALRAHIRRFYATLTATAMGSPTGSKRSSRSDSVAGAAPRSSPVNKSSPAGLSDNQRHLGEELTAEDLGLLHGDAVIEPGGSDEDGEFSPSEFDAESLSNFSDSTSLNSSILQHSFVNGRRYHRYRHGRYPIPNDDTEQNREDMLHTMMMEATDGKLYYAPIGNHPQKIIDLGTGTGLWAIERIDLSPIQPSWVPQNVTFIIDDVEAEWLNGHNWDFVHLRNMIPVMKSPVDLLKQAYDHMKPGGWIELQDVDGDVHSDDDTVPDDWPLKRFTEILLEGFAKFGTNAHAAVFGGQYLEEAGFVNIQHNYIKLPYGTWPKDKVMRLVGMYYRTACEEFFPAVGAIHFPMLGWEKNEMEVFFMQCRQAMRDPKVHAYGKMHFWSGQKPLDAP